MLQQLLYGVALGGVYALAAVAFSMVYGIVRLINLAFGALFAVGAYVAVFFLGGGILVLDKMAYGPALGLIGAILVSMAIVGALGWLVDLIAYRPLRSRPMATMITSAGVYFFIEGGLGLIFGAREQAFPRETVLGGPPFEVAGLVINRPQVAILVVALSLALIVVVVLRKTLYGLKTLACAHDLRSAELQGVNSNRVITSTFIIGSMMAALAGVLYAALFNFVSPTMGFRAGLLGLVAAVLGGIGNIPGALLGGILLGVVQSLGVAYIPGAQGYGDGFAFLILILLLWLRPEGLLGDTSLTRPGAIERPLGVIDREFRRTSTNRARANHPV